LTAAADTTYADDPSDDLTRLAIWVAGLAAVGIVGAFAPLDGILLDGLLLVWLAINARSSGHWSDASTVLMLVPLLRLLWATMPIQGVPQLDWAVFIAAPFAIATQLIARSVRLDRHAIGLDRPAKPLIQGLVVVGFGVAGVVAALALGDRVAWGVTAGVFAIRTIPYALLMAYAEGLAFRGVIPAVLERYAPGWGLVLGAGACAALAIDAASLTWALLTVGLAIVTAAVVRRTGSLWGAILGQALFLILLNI
jgi:hypothetical protein